jgi:energy-coupling factor transporter transmembrane protein EcfT
VHVFYDRTVKFQIGRHSPFSIWDWKQYGAGYPDLHLLQRVLQVLLVIGAVAVYFVPRRKTWRQLAALTAALLIGFEIVLTHWFYLYLPWFFPFVALVVFSTERAPVAAEVPEPVERKPRALVAAG